MRTVIITVIGLLAFYLFISLFGMFCSSEPKRFEDITNREMEQFLEWKEKERQRERDDQLFFD